MKIMITACLLVNSQRKGMDRNEGKAAASTCGMVSPTIIQNAIMPPKALRRKKSAKSPSLAHVNPTYKAH